MLHPGHTCAHDCQPRPTSSLRARILPRAATARGRKLLTGGRWRKVPKTGQQDGRPPAPAPCPEATTFRPLALGVHTCGRKSRRGAILSTVAESFPSAKRSLACGRVIRVRRRPSSSHEASTLLTGWRSPRFPYRPTSRTGHASPHSAARQDPSRCSSAYRLTSGAGGGLGSV